MLSLPGLCRGCCKRSGRDLLKISHIKSIDLRAFFLLVYHFHLARNNTPQVPSELWSMSLDSAWPLFPGSLWWQSCGSSVQLQEREGSLADPPAPPHKARKSLLSQTAARRMNKLHRPAGKLRPSGNVMGLESCRDTEGTGGNRRKLSLMHIVV